MIACIMHRCKNILKEIRISQSPRIFFHYNTHKKSTFRFSADYPAMKTWSQIIIVFRLNTFILTVAFFKVMVILHLYSH